MSVFIALFVVMVTRLKVTLTGEQRASNFIVRHLKIDDLSSPGTSHLVIQLHFLSWPHHGVPGQCLPLLQVNPGIRFTFSLSWPHHGVPEQCLALLQVNPWH